MEPIVFMENSQNSKLMMVSMNVNNEPSLKILSSKVLILLIKMLNMKLKRHTLIGKVPKMNIYDCHYICEHRMKFGGHGSNCIESIEDSSKKPTKNQNCYTMLFSLSTFHLVSKGPKFTVGCGHQSHNIV